MTVSQAKLDAATIGYRVIYKQGFDAAAPFHEPFCQEVPSNGSAEEYLIPGGAPALRKWVGERQLKQLKVYNWRITNEKYESTVVVPREKFEDDEGTGLGFYNGQVAQMGARTRTHPSKLLATLLESGFDDVCYDGVEFFSTAHPLKSGTQSNKGTQALDVDAFDGAMQAMLEMKDYQGERIDPVSMGGKIYLVVPPALRAAAMAIVSVDKLAGGATNKNYKAAELIVCPYLTSSTKWYLLVGGNVRPFIKQNRTQPEFQSLTAPDSDRVVLEDEYLWGIRWRYNMGYGVYQLAYGSTGVD